MVKDRFCRQRTLLMPLPTVHDFHLKPTKEKGNGRRFLYMKCLYIWTPDSLNVYTPYQYCANTSNKNTHWEVYLYELYIFTILGFIKYVKISFTLTLYKPVLWDSMWSIVAMKKIRGIGIKGVLVLSKPKLNWNVFIILL